MRSFNRVGYLERGVDSFRSCAIRVLYILPKVESLNTAGCSLSLVARLSSMYVTSSASTIPSGRWSTSSSTSFSWATLAFL